MENSVQTVSTDLVIIGAGPVGLELALAVKQAGIEYLHLEAHQIGHTLTWWPRNTHFFSTPERIALAGVPIQSNDQKNPTGEDYLAYLRAFAQQFDLQVSTYEAVETLEVREDNSFRLYTRGLRHNRIIDCRRVVLATGGMAFPNRLEIPGEDLPHVSHYFNDPHQYFRQSLLVVGGMNSAIEAALRCWRAGANVTLSYRRGDLKRTRVKPELLLDFDTVVRENNITFLPSTMPVEILPDKVVLAQIDEGVLSFEDRLEVQADFVLLLTGFISDMSLFRQAGVELTGERLAPTYNRATMETNVPGLYVAGTAAGGTQHEYKLFIETSHIDVKKIVAALMGRPFQSISEEEATAFEAQTLWDGRTPVLSTALYSVGYNPDDKTLEIEFASGHVYQYAQVAPELYEGLLNAESKGRYFDQYIRKAGFAYRKLQ